MAVSIAWQSPLPYTKLVCEQLVQLKAVFLCRAKQKSTQVSKNTTVIYVSYIFCVLLLELTEVVTC